MDLWARTDSVVYVRSGRAFFGWDAVAAAHQFSGGSPGTFVSAETRVRVLNRDSGVATAFIQTRSPDGEYEGWFTITVAVERRADGWKVIYAHGSYPDPGATPWGDEGLPVG
jgi:hypothetical protein